MIMKRKSVYLIFFAVFLNTGFMQDNNLLDGKVFYGKAIEVTSPDVNRIPELRDEVIVFNNGKVTCELFKNYSKNESEYTAEVDGRRAIAVEVITFTSTLKAEISDKEVIIEFSGEVYAGEKLTGVLKISYPSSKTEEYSIVGEVR